jgi:hypothetical protein
MTKRRIAVQAHAYRWATTVAMLALTAETLGAGRKWR